MEPFQELAAEDLAQNPLRKEEPGISRTYPLSVIPRQAARRDDAMNVGMMLQLLIPGVEDAEESDFGAEMLGVGGDVDQRLGAATEQQPVDHFLVLQGQRRQLVGQRKHDMSVRRGEQLGATRGQPAVARLALAPRTVPVAARVIRDGAMTAAGALVQMAAHRGGAAPLDGYEYFQMQPGEPGGSPVHESAAGGGYDIGQLQQWPFHSLLAGIALGLRGRREGERIKGTGGSFEMPL